MKLLQQYKIMPQCLCIVFFMNVFCRIFACCIIIVPVCTGDMFAHSQAVESEMKRYREEMDGLLTKAELENCALTKSVYACLKSLPPRLLHEKEPNIINNVTKNVMFVLDNCRDISTSTIAKLRVDKDGNFTSLFKLSGKDGVSLRLLECSKNDNIDARCKKLRSQLDREKRAFFNLITSRDTMRDSIAKFRLRMFDNSGDSTKLLERLLYLVDRRRDIVWQLTRFCIINARSYDSFRQISPDLLCTCYSPYVITKNLNDGVCGFGTFLPVKK